MTEEAADKLRRWLVAELKATPEVVAAFGSPVVFASSFSTNVRRGVYIDRLESAVRPGGIPSEIVEVLLRCFRDGTRAQANAAHSAVRRAVSRTPGLPGLWKVDPRAEYGLLIGVSRAFSAVEPERTGQGSHVWESVVRVRATVRVLN